MSARLAELLGQPIAAAGLVLEDVTVKAAGKHTVVEVVVDLPDDAVGSVPLDDIVQVAQAIGPLLDDAVSGTFALEVTSPGVSRPLRTPRHFKRARTRLVCLEMKDGSQRAGRLQTANDEGIVLDDAQISYDEIGVGHVEVEFASQKGER